jgi:hypothetical protein
LSQRRALPNSDSACTTIFDEVDGKSIEAPRDLVYYCSFIGCIRSATPGLCDLTSPIAKKILDLESRKVYILKGLSLEELRAHTWEAHAKAVEDVTVCPKPVIAEERKFRVPLEASPGASGWLMRIQNRDNEWGNWMGVDRDIVAGGGFITQEQRFNWDDLPPKLLIRSKDCTPDAEYSETEIKSEASETLPVEETGCNVDATVEQNLIDVNTFKKPHSWNAFEMEVRNQAVRTIEKETSHNPAKINLRESDQPSVSAFRASYEAECDQKACTTESVQSRSDEGSFRRPDVSSDDDSSSDVSITIRRKRCILNSIMDEYYAIYSRGGSGRLSCKGETSESTSPHGPASSGSICQQSHVISSISAGKRRTQDRGADSEDDDGGNLKRHKNSSSSFADTARARRLACPFNKHDSKIYSPFNEGQDMALKFRACGGPGWLSTSKIK